MLNRVKGACFTFLALVAGTFGVFVFGGFTLLLFVVHPKLYRKFFDTMLGLWSHFIIALIELMMGVKVKISGDEMKPGERNLILMNHRTRLDWMYFWSVLIRQSGISTEKVILKAPLKKIPGIGWAMQVGAFIFIERKWDEDKKILTKMLDYFADLKYRTQILLFPEGTDFTARTKAKSDEFARKNEVAEYEYVLHPRTTGFTFITQHMQKTDHLDAVYDVTVAYPYNIPQNQMDIVLGNFPKEVHFHIKRYPVQSLPTTEEGLQNWCKKRWQEKEERLKLFYQQRSFTVADDPNKNINNTSEESQSFSNNNSYLYPPNSAKSRDASANILMKVALVSWSIFISAIVWLFFSNSFVYWTVVGQFIFFTVMTSKYGGFEFFQIDYFNRFFRDNKIKKIH